MIKCNICFREDSFILCKDCISTFYKRSYKRKGNELKERIKPEIESFILKLESTPKIKEKIKIYSNKSIYKRITLSIQENICMKERFKDVIKRKIEEVKYLNSQLKKRIEIRRSEIDRECQICKLINIIYILYIYLIIF